MSNRISMAAGWVALGAVAWASPLAAQAACDGDCPAHVVKVRCSAINDFGYIASARGTLKITGRPRPSVLSVSGTLKVNAKFYGDPDHSRSVHVRGTLDVLGQYLSADVISDDSLQSMFLSFVSGTSQIQGTDTTQYQTECRHSVVDVPLLTDIAPTGSLRFENLPDGPTRTHIGVVNVGNLPVSGEVIVHIRDQDVTGTLHGGDGTPGLESGEQGTIALDLPAGSLARCSQYPVILDVDQQLQSGQFDPFGDDSADVASPCLRWDTPITDDALGTAADPLIQGRTLSGIVSSQEVARADGNRCSACHFAGSGKPYSPPAGLIAPTQDIGGRSWAQLAGWVDEFNNQGIKPGYLKQAFQRWRDDGAL